MRIYKSSSQNLYLGITIFLVFIVHLKAQDSREDIVLAHNKAREEVGVGPLRWDDEVAAYARDHANKLKDDCIVKLSDGPYGQSFTWTTGSMTAVEAVKMWVDEKDNYDYETNTCAEVNTCFDYTQVVWRNTKKVGCAKVRCSDKPVTIFTCNYDPPGNWPGEKPY